MANSGPGGSWLAGNWDCLRLPVESWRAWFWEAGQVRSTDDWDELPDSVLLIYVYHQGHKRTRMVAVDEYPPPPGVDGSPRMGAQVGEVGGPEWAAARKQIEAESWPRPTT